MNTNSDTNAKTLYLILCVYKTLKMLDLLLFIFVSVL